MPQFSLGGSDLISMQRIILPEVDRRTAAYVEKIGCFQSGPKLFTGSNGANRRLSAQRGRFVLPETGVTLHFGHISLFDSMAVASRRARL